MVNSFPINDNRCFVVDDNLKIARDQFEYPNGQIVENKLHFFQTHNITFTQLWRWYNTTNYHQEHTER